jgi:hypothetical protein
VPAFILASKRIVMKCPRFPAQLAKQIFHTALCQPTIIASGVLFSQFCSCSFVSLVVDIENPQALTLPISGC